MEFGGVAFIRVKFCFKVIDFMRAKSLNYMDSPSERIKDYEVFTPVIKYGDQKEVTIP